MSDEEFEKLVSFREKIDLQRERGSDAGTLELLEREYAQRRAALAGEEEVTAEVIEERVRETLYGTVSDDAVIGRALRRSLAVIAAFAAFATFLYFLLSRPEAAGPEQSIEQAPPRAVAASADPPELPFTDITAASGIDFVHHNGAVGDKLLPETMGGGVAFFDYDNDGDPDLLLVNSAPWPGSSEGRSETPTPALYANDGAGGFSDVTAAAGLDLTLYGMGVAVADVDGDGRRDVYLTAVGENRLLKNLGGRFEDITRKAGVAGAEEDWSTCAAFFDYDNDGFLDLFVCNYVRWSPQIDFEVDYRLTGIGRAYGPPMNYEGTYSRLYRGRGDGTFEEVSEAAGIRLDNPATGRPAGKALGIAPGDLDDDGWIDLVVANDTVGNLLFHNRGDGTFEEDGAAFGLAYDRNGNATGAMGIDSGQHRNDGEIAFLIGNFANEMSSVYVSQGDRSLFADEAIPEGLGAPSRTSLTFGILLFDADLDGRLDLLQTNGHLEEEIAQVDPSQSYAQSAQLFWTAGGEAQRTFVPVPEASTADLGRPLIGRASAYADIDGDGDLDVIMTQAGGRPLLLRNDQKTGHHWLRLRLEAGTGDRDALGARVELTAGGVTQRRRVMPTKSYLAQSELELTFGLGEALEVDSLEIVWPDGRRQTVEVREIDRLLVVAPGS